MSKVVDGPWVGSGLGVISLSWKLFLNIYQLGKIRVGTFRAHTPSSCRKACTILQWAEPKISPVSAHSSIPCAALRISMRSSRLLYGQTSTTKLKREKVENRINLMADDMVDVWGSKWVWMYQIVLLWPLTQVCGVTPLPVLRGPISVCQMPAGSDNSQRAGSPCWNLWTHWPSLPVLIV